MNYIETVVTASGWKGEHSLEKGMLLISRVMETFYCLYLGNN